jgi:hypothetical protein
VPAHAGEQLILGNASGEGHRAATIAPAPYVVEDPVVEASAVPVLVQFGELGRDFAGVGDANWMTNMCFLLVVTSAL